MVDSIVATGDQRSRKSILLTGASGFLGQHVLQSMLHSLSADEVEICALIGKTKGFQAHLDAWISSTMNQHPLVYTDSLDLSIESDVKVWMESHPKFDICIHTAALSSPKLCQEQPDKANALNVTRAFFDNLRKSNTFIIALSTDQVYDGSKAPYREEEDDDDHSRPEPRNVYGQTKLDMEECLLEPWRRDSSTDGVVILRSSIILGPKAPILPEAAHDTFLHFCISRQHEETEFYSDEIRSVVSVKDVVATVLWFVSANLGYTTTKNNSRSEALLNASGAGGVFNMGGPAPISRMDMAHAVFGHFGLETKLLIATKRAHLPMGPVPSPLNISMDSTKLTQLLQRNFLTLDEIVRDTFPNG
jgi:nucleoside-diphosphate-sugar epimerase